MLRERITPILPLLALALLLTACFARLVAEPGALLVDGDHPSVDGAQRFQAIAVGNDLTRLFLPHHLQIAAEIARLGRPPMWDSFGFGGRPRVGNPQAGLWYPPVWVVWYTGAPAALGWLTVAHLFWAGLGTYVLGRALGLGRVAATVAAGCFEASPYLLAQAFEGHLPHIWAASWYPWAFWAAVLLRRGNARGALALPWILALAFVAGHPQEWYYLVFTLGVWVLFDAFVELRRGQQRGALCRLGCAAAIGLLSMGLVGVEMVPDLCARPWTLRIEPLSLKPSNHYGLHPVNILQLLGPFALGGPADYFGHDNYWETVQSIGWAPLVLAVLALARSRRRNLVRGWGILTGVALVFAAGRGLGLFPLLGALVPGMNQFRVPARSLFLASLGAAVLAGVGIDTIRHATPGSIADWGRTFRRYRCLLFLIMAGFIIGQVACWQFDFASYLQQTAPRQGDATAARPSYPYREVSRWLLASARQSRDPAFWLACGGTTAALAWLRRRPHARLRVAATLGVLAVAELGLFGFTLVSTAPPSRFLGPDSVSAALTRVAPSASFRIRARDGFYSDLDAARHGFEKTNINDFFQIKHASELYKHLYWLFENVPPLDPTDPTAEIDEQHERAVTQGVLDRMNVALLVTDRPQPEAPWPIAASGTRDGTPFTIYRNPSALPRAYVVPRARPAPERASSLNLFATVDPRQAVLMLADPLSPNGPRQSFIPAAYNAHDPDHVIVNVTTEAPGLLVVADTWMPGWTAELNGRPVPILRGNRAQRVVVLPQAGAHQVVMHFRPPGLVAGLFLSMTSAVLWLFAVFFIIRVSQARTATREKWIAPKSRRAQPLRHEAVLR
jgi:hypothetical protein